MWANFDGRPYDRASLAAHIAAIDFSHWRRKDGSKGVPLYLVFHNTSEPTIALWLSWSLQVRQQYILNAEHMYEVEDGWRAGPHFFVPPTVDPCAFGFSDPGTAGTHASCFNSDSIGIEQVGEFNVEAYDTGPGAIVQDNTIYLAALLYRRIGIAPDTNTLKFHIECKADDHDCPGKFARDKAGLIAKIKAKMAELAGAAPVAPSPSPAAVMQAAQATPGPRPVLFHVHGKMSTFGGPHDTGVGSSEGLALYTSAQQLADTLGGDWVLTASQAGAYGLARRINPDKSYLACRWTGQYPFLRTAAVHVSANGKSVVAHAVDWGPNVNTGRVADLSPGLAKALGLDTDGACEVIVYADGK